MPDAGDNAMAIATPIPFLRARFCDRCNNPLSGGKVFTYEPNSLTPKDTYTTPNAGTKNTNPIILDAAGEADIYLAGRYRIIVQDAKGVVIDDRNDVGMYAQTDQDIVMTGGTSLFAFAQTLQADLNDTYRKSDVYTKTESYNKSETYSKTEVFSKEETRDRAYIDGIVTSAASSVTNYLTQSALLAYTPTVTGYTAKALDTKKVWYWNGSAWADTGLSELELAKADASSKANSAESNAKNWIDLKATLNNVDMLEQRVGANGKTYSYTDKEGYLFIPFLQKSVQREIIDLKDSANKLTDSPNLLNITDATGKPVLLQTSSGALHANDFVTKNGSLDKRLAAIEVNQTANLTLQKTIDRAIAAYDASPVLIDASLMSNVEGSMGSIFAPILTRITANKFIIFAEARENGDYGRVKLVQRTFTVNADLTLTKSSVVTSAEYGTDENGKDYDTYNQTCVRLATGRILSFYIVRSIASFNVDDTPVYNYFKFLSRYSDDDGVTWSTPQDFRAYLPTIGLTVPVLPTPAKPIQIKTGIYKGRIILPCYAATNTYPTDKFFTAFLMYSDDNGATWARGATSIHPYATNESAIAEIDGGILWMTRDISNFKSTEISNDGGVTTSNLTLRRTDIVTGKCQTGMIQAANNGFDLATSKLLVSCPSRSDATRFDLGLYCSYDNGTTFTLLKKLTDTSISYSDLAMINERTVLVAYAGNDNKDIRYTIVNFKHLFI